MAWVQGWLKTIYSGTCLCGHQAEDHHLMIVQDPEVAEAIGPYGAQECEFYGCNEEGALDEEGRLHCGHYVDVEEPDESIRASWKGTQR